VRWAGSIGNAFAGLTEGHGVEERVTGSPKLSWPEAVPPAPRSAKCRDSRPTRNYERERFSVSILEEGGRFGLKCLTLEFFPVGDKPGITQHK